MASASDRARRLQRRPGQLGPAREQRCADAGDIEPGPATETLRFQDPARGIYKRLLVEGNRLRGVVLYGDTHNAAWFSELIESRRDVVELRDHLLLGGPELLQRKA